MKQITANVYIEDRFSIPPDYRGSAWGFVTTSEGIVVIDTPMMPRDAVKLRDDLAQRGEVRYVISTHHHLDHVLGNFFLPGTLISQEGVKELLAAPLTRVAVRREVLEEVLKAGEGKEGYIRRIVAEFDPESLDLLKNYHLKAPKITFSEKLNLYLGGHTFELIHFGGHTPAHIGVYIPQEKVLFTGDNFTNKTQPSLAESQPLEWVESLRKMEAMDIDLVVPGHGEVCDRTVLREFRRFIEQCIAITREAIKQGMTKAQAADKISFEELYPKKKGGQAVHPGPDMQRQNVSRLYEMLTEIKTPAF